MEMSITRPTTLEASAIIIIVYCSGLNIKTRANMMN